ncbi:MAG: AhpC/TSA family protein [Dysgonamonadaceae bacterium]|jgi:peroxiredoxin|nr:AhpC/TSA family protein [Dysgonamonadaceae bacterium]
MKKFLLLLVVGALAASCSEKNNLIVTGTVKGVPSGKIYLQKFVNKMFFVIDSTDIKDSTFKFAVNVELPEIYGLTLDTAKGSFFVFFDASPATVDLDTAQHYRNTKVTGSASHELYQEYQKLRGVKIDEFIRQHPASLVSAYVFYRFFSYRLTPDEIRANISLLDSSLWNTQYVKTLQELAETLEIVDVGKPAPDFALNTPDGNTVKFSDKLGNGYVLLDFWAAWCGPCRRENPNVVRVFNKYKDKDFDVFGVSLDHNKEAWVKAIEKDSLAWTHVSDLKYWESVPAKIYGVRAIPSNFLIDKNGIIVAKNLRGENLDELLNEYLN